MPNIETVVFENDDYSNTNYNDARQPTSFTFNLTAFQKLKCFRMNIEFNNNEDQDDDLDYLFFHFKYADGDEAYYSVQKENDSYQLTNTSKQFMLEST